MYIVLRTIEPGRTRFIFGTGFLLRATGGLVSAWFFFVDFPVSDSSVYFDTANSLLNKHSIWSILSGNFDKENLIGQPRVLFFVQLLSFFHFLSGGSFWIVALQFALLSFLVSWHFVREVIKIFPTHRNIIEFSFLFIPSVIFWSSGILKDAPAFWALLVAVLIVLKIREGKKVTAYEWIFGVLSMLTLFNIRHYLLIILLLFMGLIFALHFIRKVNGRFKWPIAISVFALFVISSQLIHPYLKIQRLPQTLYENNQLIAEKTSEESQIGIVINDPTWHSVIKEIPASLFAGLFRPAFFDNTPAIGIIHKAENLLLLTWTMLSILLLIRSKPEINWLTIAPALLCIFMLATLLALSTPNLGTLVRYRNAIVPFSFLIAGILPFQYFASQTKG